VRSTVVARKSGGVDLRDKEGVKAAVREKWGEKSAQMMRRADLTRRDLLLILSIHSAVPLSV
jgi:hypothetical protein